MLDLRLGVLLLRLIVFIRLSHVLGTSIGSYFEICSAHVCPPTVDVTNLHFSDQQIRDFLVVVAHEAESSTGFGEWIANNLVLFDLSKLLEVLFESLISEVVV